MEQIMSLKKEIYLEKILSILPPGSKIESEYINAASSIIIRCPNGHVRTTTCNDIVSRNGAICRVCTPATNSKKTTEQVSQILATRDLILCSEYLGAAEPITVTRISCGHTYIIPRASSAIRGRAVLCPECKPNYNLTEELSKNNHTLLSEYSNRKTNVRILNNNCGHEYLINPGHYLYDKIGVQCIVCGTIKHRFFTGLINHEVMDTYTTAQTPIRVKNTSCGHEYSVTPNNLVCAGSGLICRICNPTISKPEEEIKQFIADNYNGWVVHNDRSLISPKELDIVLPDLGLAFEINGEYWHRDRPTYHQEKTNAVEALEYQLIHISDIQWNTKQDIIKSRILSLLGKSNKIYARNCVVKPLDYMPKEFLHTNHIQGIGSPTGINYGLYHKDELVAVMTFKKTQLYSAEYELVRYCSKLNTSIIGGPSKLLKAFARDHNNPSILSYAARDWSTGNLYERLGFTFIKYTEPGYHYFKNNEVFSRQMFQKHKLKELFPKSYSDAKSEREILLEEGYHRYYDSGNLVFVKIKLE